MAVFSFFRRKPVDEIIKETIETTRKYDVNWWVRHLNIAHAEDSASGLTDPVRQHPWVAIGVDYCGRNVSRAPFTLYSGDTVVESGVDFELFRDVNPYMSSAQLFRATESWLKAAGEAFWVYDPFDMALGQHPKSIYVFPADKMKHKTDSQGRLTQWIYQSDKIEIPFTTEQVVHFAYWNKWDAYRGVSPLAVLDQETALDYYAGRSNLAMIRNGSVPDGVLSGDQYVNEEQAKEVRERWYKDHQGPDRGHRLHVLGQGITYQAIAATPSDMEYHESKRWNRGTILARIGVPGVLVGAMDDRTPLSGSDTKHQKQIFWTETLVPDMSLMEDKLRTDYFARWAPTLEGRFKLDDIQELQIDENERQARLRENIKVGLMTINEAREEIKRDPVDGGEVPYIPMALVPLGEEKESAPFPPEPAEPKYIVEDVFAEKAPRYTEAFKDAHWRMWVKGWEAIEEKYLKELQSWVYGIRKHVLGALAEKDVNDVLAATESAYWDGQTVALQELSAPQFNQAMLFAETQLIALFGQVDIPIGINWTIFDTDAVQMVARRVDELSKITTTINGQVGDTIAEAITNGWSEKETADMLRQRFSFASNRMETVARTEIGNVLSDSRMAGFEDVGVSHLEWSSARDGKVRSYANGDEFDHTDAFNNANGPVPIGEPFPNGLRHENDINGEAGNVINCRCVTLPATGD